MREWCFTACVSVEVDLSVWEMSLLRVTMRFKNCPLILTFIIHKIWFEWHLLFMSGCSGRTQHCHFKGEMFCHAEGNTFLNFTVVHSHYWKHASGIGKVLKGYISTNLWLKRFFTKTPRYNTVKCKAFLWFFWSS